MSEYDINAKFVLPNCFDSSVKTLLSDLIKGYDGYNIKNNTSGVYTNNEAQNNYDKDSMTYYAEDDVLTDDCDEMVDDPGRFDEAVKVLLDSTNDETEVYIRDDSTYTDYAVSISNGSYQREVLGYIEELEDEPRRPKHKKDEDE